MELIETHTTRISFGHSGGNGVHVRANEAIREPARDPGWGHLLTSWEGGPWVGSSLEGGK